VLILGGVGYSMAPDRRDFVQGDADYSVGAQPHNWPFWIGALLVAMVLIGRDRITAWNAPLTRSGLQSSTGGPTRRAAATAAEDR